MLLPGLAQPVFRPSIPVECQQGSWSLQAQAITTPTLKLTIGLGPLIPFRIYGVQFFSFNWFSFKGPGFLGKTAVVKVAGAPRAGLVFALKRGAKRNCAAVGSSGGGAHCLTTVLTPGASCLGL